MGHDIQACSFKENVCWNCNKSGHRSVDYPSARKMSSGVGAGARTASVGGSSASSTRQKPKTPPRPEARALEMLVDTATTADDAITGMFLVNSTPARVLFDCEDNRSFMATRFCDKLNLPISMLPEPLEVEVSSGKIVPVTTSVFGISIEIDGSVFPVTCLVTPIPSFDVVLGMNWLSCHKASIKYHKKLISFPLSDGTRVIALGERGGFGCPLISMMKARKSIAKGCDTFLAYVINAKKEKNTVADIPVVRDFPEVFPDELPGLSPVREVEYRIELMPGSTPMAKAPYRLAPSEIRDMMTQIQDLLDRYYRRFIKDFSKIVGPLIKLTRKDVSFQWGDEQEKAFHTLKQLLCQAPILALPEGTDDFMVYCDASYAGLGCVLMHREKVIAYASRQLKTHEKNYPANVVADALSRKGSIDNVKFMRIEIVSDLIERLKITQIEALRDEPLKFELLVKRKKDLIDDSRGLKTFNNRIWVPLLGELRELIMNEVHKSRLSINPGSTKMYHDLKTLYWWPIMKKDINIQA
ncbi:uncharacterized protein [Rutidosis leptorrhynchoides]|uniref:uncharacterized protein n=1 Tax=Rutidosis leptorrhynchoides TaxID=125765 RepID=UPI003A99FE7B